MKYALTVFAICTASISSADISIRFIEGAPKDRFVIQNSGNCDFQDFDVLLDLSSSAAGLIFDTTSQGAGVEVFQPMEIVAGQSFLGEFDAPTDGDNKFNIPFKTLPKGAEMAFTIDVDDTLKNSASGQIIVRGQEIEGATVSVGNAVAAFDRSSRAQVAVPTCDIS